MTKESFNPLQEFFGHFYSQPPRPTEEEENYMYPNVFNSRKIANHPTENYHISHYSLPLGDNLTGCFKQDTELYRLNCECINPAAIKQHEDWSYHSGSNLDFVDKASSYSSQTPLAYETSCTDIEDAAMEVYDVYMASLNQPAPPVTNSTDPVLRLGMLLSHLRS